MVGEGLETLVTETTNLPSKQVRTITDRVVYDTVIFDGDQSDGYGYISLDGTSASGENAGDRLLSEQAGFSILLDGNPSDLDFASGDKLLAEDETLGEQLVLNGTDSTSTNANDEIVRHCGRHEPLWVRRRN